MKEHMHTLIFAAVLGSGLVAGIFFAFSTFVMRALGRLPQSQGISAMQAINVTVINPWFFLAFFGTGAVCLAIAFLALGSAAAAQRLLAGCALYLVGCLGVTKSNFVCHCRWFGPWDQSLLVESRSCRTYRGNRLLLRRR